MGSIGSHYTVRIIISRVYCIFTPNPSPYINPPHQEGKQSTPAHTHTHAHFSTGLLQLNLIMHTLLLDVALYKTLSLSPSSLTVCLSPGDRPQAAEPHRSAQPRALSYSRSFVSILWQPAKLSDRHAHAHARTCATHSHSHTIHFLFLSIAQSHTRARARKKPNRDLLYLTEADRDDALFPNDQRPANQDLQQPRPTLM